MTRCGVTDDPGPTNHYSGARLSPDSLWGVDLPSRRLERLPQRRAQAPLHRTYSQCLQDHLWSVLRHVTFSYLCKYSKCQFIISSIVYNYFSKGLDRDFKFNSYEYFIVQFIKLESYHQLLNGTQMYWREWRRVGVRRRWEWRRYKLSVTCSPGSRYSLSRRTRLSWL